MKFTVKFTNWALITIGALAIIGSVNDNNVSGLVGGLMFLVAGIVNLNFIYSSKFLK